ncbi:histone-lysine N-methyltransferase SETMAR-like [Amblyomma americanum]
MIHQELKDERMSQTAVVKWYKLFKGGRESVEDEPRSVRLSTSRTDDNVQCVREVRNPNHRLRVQTVAAEIAIDKMTVHSIITGNVAMLKICAILVPKAFTEEQKQTRVFACEDLLQHAEEVPGFVKNIFTGDDTCIFEHDREPNWPSSDWHTPAQPNSKKAGMSKSRVKAMLIVFYDARGVVHYKFIPEGQTVYGVFCLEVLRRLNRRVCRVRPAIAGHVNWKLHHDSAPSHTCIKVSDHRTINATPIQSQLGTSRLFPIPKNETLPQRTPPLDPPNSRQRSLQECP